MNKYRLPNININFTLFFQKGQEKHVYKIIISIAITLSPTPFNY